MVGVAPNALGYSTLLIRQLANLLAKCCRTSRSSATTSLPPMFAPSTPEPRGLNAEQFKLYALTHQGGLAHSCASNINCPTLRDFEGWAPECMHNTTTPSFASSSPSGWPPRMAENFVQFKVFAGEGQTPRGAGYSRRCYILACTDSYLTPCFKSSNK